MAIWKKKLSRKICEKYKRRKTIFYKLFKENLIVIFRHIFRHPCAVLEPWPAFLTKKQPDWVTLWAWLVSQLVLSPPLDPWCHPTLFWLKWELQLVLEVLSVRDNWVIINHVQNGLKWTKLVRTCYFSGSTIVKIVEITDSPQYCNNKFEQYCSNLSKLV